MKRRVLCFEYATGGGGWEDAGLLEPDSAFLAEGTLMLQALAADLARLDQIEATLLWDARLPSPVFAHPGSSLFRLPIATLSEWRAALRGAAGQFDEVLFVAPECDGVLERLTAELAASDLRLACPHPTLVRLASNKHATAEHLARAGVAVPRGRFLRSGERLPSDADYPAVLKPVDGAGSHLIRVLDRPDGLAVCPPHAAGWRLESLEPGRSASVLVARRSEDREESPTALPASWQILSDDCGLRYLGGETPLPPSLDERARKLALRAAATLPPWRGFVGIDLVLGDDPTGAADRVIEVNPRVTTSYIGVRRVVGGNLLRPLFCETTEDSDWRLAAAAPRVCWTAHS